MKPICFYIPEKKGSIVHAVRLLAQWGYNISPEAGPDTTHVLLPVPTDTVQLPQLLPKNAVIFGTGTVGVDRPCIDLLEDEIFLARNAAITAHCAVQLAMSHLPVTLDGCPVLVIGWGRIGKCMAPLLRALGAEVTVAARSSRDRAMLTALGYAAVSIEKIAPVRYRLIINTVPAPVLDADTDALQLDLASTPGLLSEKALRARGLPGRFAPESAGILIANTVRRYLEGEA